MFKKNNKKKRCFSGVTDFNKLVSVNHEKRGNAY